MFDLQQELIEEAKNRQIAVEAMERLIDIYESSMIQELIPGTDYTKEEIAEYKRIIGKWGN